MILLECFVANIYKSWSKDLELQVYVVLIGMLLANLAWLVNPHACCPRMDNMLGCQDMGCSTGMNSGCPMEIVQTDTSSCQMNPDYFQLTLADQFSKGVNNYIAETTAASMPVFAESDIYSIFSSNTVLDQGEYDSKVIPPIDKPPACD